MEDERMYPFHQAAALLPEHLSKLLNKTDDYIRTRAREIRLRQGQPISLTLERSSIFVGSGGTAERPEDGYIITKSDMTDAVSALCQHSLYSFQDQLNHGYVTAKGGHRAGICGTAVVTDGKITAVRDVSSVNIRIAREIKGSGQLIFDELYGNGPEGTIVISPPAGGKTTLLRDIARLFSEAGKRVALVDERGELAACYNGCPQKDIGALCDVLDGYPKHIGISYAVRTLNPQVVICDEIGDKEDLEALAETMKTGVPVIISAHAADFQELMKRKVLSDIVREGFVKNVVVLYGNDNPGTVRRIIKTGGSHD